MKALERWLSREKRRKLRQPRLDDAVLGHRALRYIVHRLRFVTLRVVLRTALHIVEVVALSTVFPARFLGPILTLRHASLLLSNLHWGALEVQRRSLRDAYRGRDTAAFVRVARHWSAAAVTTILFEQLLVAAIVAISTRNQSGFSIYHAYGIACGLRLAMDTWVRTQQSVVFAVARIRRNFFSIIVTDIIEVFGLLIAWLAIGPYAFALILLLIGGLKSLLTLWFTHATRVQLGLPATGGSMWRNWRHGTWLQLPWSQALKFAVLSMGLQVDSLVILCLSAGLAGGSGVVLSLSIHALSPLLGAGFAWTRVFYFDFIRLRRFQSSLLACRFGRILDRVALAYPLVLLALVVPVVYWLAPSILVTTPLVLCGFVVARSLFALRQMEAYSYADHKVQARQALILVLITTALVLTQWPLTILLVGLTLGLATAAVAGGRARIPVELPRACGPLGAEVFLGWLASQSRPIRVAKLQWNQTLTTGERICRGLMAFGFTSPTWINGRNQLILAVSGAADCHAIRRALISATAGTLKSLKLEPQRLSGSEVCRALWLDSIATASSPIAKSEGAARHLTCDEFNATVAAFGREFPDGICLQATRGNLQKLGDAAAHEVRHVLRHFGQRESKRRHRSSGVEVAVYRPMGEVKAVFLLPRTSPRSSRFTVWRKQLMVASIQDTFASIISGVNGSTLRQVNRQPARLDRLNP